MKRPIGVIVVSILLFIYALYYFGAGLYFLLLWPFVSDDAGLKPFLNFAIIFSVLCTIFAILLGVSGVFIWKGKRWARVIIGILTGFTILGSVKGAITLDIASIFMLAVSLWIFIYLFFFKSANKFFSKGP